MLRLVLRSLGFVCLACSFSAAMVDIARSLGEHRLVVSPFERLVVALQPTGLDWAHGLIARNGRPWMWDPGLVTILNMPAFVVLAAVALLLLWLGRPPRQQFGFSWR